MTDDPARDTFSAAARWGGLFDEQSARRQHWRLARYLTGTEDFRAMVNLH